MIVLYRVWGAKVYEQMATLSALSILKHLSPPCCVDQYFPKSQNWHETAYEAWRVARELSRIDTVLVADADILLRKPLDFSEHTSHYNMRMFAHAGCESPPGEPPSFDSAHYLHSGLVMLGQCLPSHVWDAGEAAWNRVFAKYSNGAWPRHDYDQWVWNVMYYTQDIAPPPVRLIASDDNKENAPFYHYYSTRGADEALSRMREDWTQCA